MSEWSVWSQCSCVSQRQQRYRVALSPATRGQQCTAVETQSRSCSVSHCDGELTTTVKGKICIREAYLQFCYCSYQLQFYFEHTNQGNQTSCCAFDPAHVYDFHVLVHVDTIQCFFFLLIFVDCEAPFVYSACGAPCEKQCALQGHEDLCLGVKECTPGCYCPQVNIELAKVYFIFYRINQSVCFTIIYW